MNVKQSEKLLSIRFGSKLCSLDCRFGQLVKPCFNSLNVPRKRFINFFMFVKFRKMKINFQEFLVELMKLFRKTFDNSPDIGVNSKDTLITKLSNVLHLLVEVDEISEHEMNAPIFGTGTLTGSFIISAEKSNFNSS